MIEALFGRLRWIVLLSLLLPAAPLLAHDPAPNQASAKGSGFSARKFYVGGGVGLSFGDVNYFEISPLIGYRVTPRLDLGVSFMFRYRQDDRYANDLTTRDYGGSLFTRYHFIPRVFLHGEYEYLDYEYANLNSSTSRDTYDSLFAGVGISNRAGRHGSVFFLALYNLTYSEDERSPYGDPWTLRIGASYGF